MLSEGTPAVDRYLAFLHAGCSDYSLELLKQAGVDMTSSQPVHQALQVFELHVTEMEKLLQEMHL